MQYYLKVDCVKLKVYTTNPRATTKTNKSINKIK